MTLVNARAIVRLTLSKTLVSRRKRSVFKPPGYRACQYQRRTIMVQSATVMANESPTNWPRRRDNKDEEKGDQPRELSFVSRLNCTTGKNEWVELPEDYDFHQEIARSAYADMLHDHDRNMRYFQALKYEIAKLKSENKQAYVLDIGTGTGLLSMMAVVAGADAVFACDAFTPMLECAKKVVKRNGFEHKIRLIPKRSTELVVGVDIPFRCNVLVTEVFDTELIGEGAICTFNHAHQELLTDSPVVIPATSTVYAQVVSSSEVEKWNSLPKSMKLSQMEINFPAAVSSCSGIPSVQDLQLDAIKTSEFTPLSPPIPIFLFDFTSKVPILPNRSAKLEFKSESSGKANAVFLWWDLEMDTSGKNTLSCQPEYVKKGPANWFNNCVPQNAEWRDHWMHSVYYIPRSAQLEESQSAILYSAHDEYSFWFDISTVEIDFPSVHPICECGVHNVLSRSQIYMMNDVERYETFIKCYEKLIVPGQSTCLCVSDCSVLPVILAKLGAKRVIVLESSGDSERICKEIVSINGKIDTIQFLKTDDIDKLGNLFVAEHEKIDLVTGDPYFQVAVYPWNNLMYWYVTRSIQPSLLSTTAKLAPNSMTIRGMAVKFTHLWKINAPVKVAAETFDLVDFDELISNSTSISDSPVDAQPLWEYESVCTSNPVTLLKLDLRNDLDKLESSGEFQVVGDTNGIALWIEWGMDLSSQTSISTGPRIQPAVGKPVEWERFSKQGVYLVRPSNKDLVRYKVSFDSSTADFLFNFS